jgi:hypothetical protein
LLIAIATAQTNDTAQGTSKQKRTTTATSSKPAQKKTPNAATSNASKTNATAPSSSSPGTHADANTPDDGVNSVLSAPPGWVPPAQNAQKAQPSGQKSTASSKPQSKKTQNNEGTPHKN